MSFSGDAPQKSDFFIIYLTLFFEAPQAPPNGIFYLENESKNRLKIGENISFVFLFYDFFAARRRRRQTVCFI